MHNKTVFIVDDDAAVRDSLALLLSLRGYSTAIFSSPRKTCSESLTRSGGAVSWWISRCPA